MLYKGSDGEPHGMRKDQDVFKSSDSDSSESKESSLPEEAHEHCSRSP